LLLASLTGPWVPAGWSALTIHPSTILRWGWPARRRSTCRRRHSVTPFNRKDQVRLVGHFLTHQLRVARDTIHLNNAVTRRDSILWIPLIVLLDQAIPNSLDDQISTVSQIQIHSQWLAQIALVNACGKYARQIRIHGVWLLCLASTHHALHLGPHNS